jgi:hypothetical protein
MVHEAIYDLLNGVCSNIFPGAAEQEINPPFLVHTQVKVNPTPDKDTTSKNDQLIYRIAAYDNTLQGAKTLADNVRSEIDGYSGYNNNTDIIEIRYLNEESGFDLESGFHYILQTYQILIRLIT